jgi:hypothetical protein
MSRYLPLCRSCSWFNGVKTVRIKALDRRSTIQDSYIDCLCLGHIAAWNRPRKCEGWRARPVVYASGGMDGDLIHTT